MSDKIIAAHDEHPVPQSHVARNDDEVEHENGEVLLTLETATQDGANTADLRLAKDGKTILIPQPTNDPNDPLNWSSFKKHAILLLVAFGSFTGDFNNNAGIPAIILQAEQWHLTPVVANYPNNLAAMMAGVSGIIWMPLINSWGRMPVLFWSSVMGLFFVLGSVLAPSFTCHYAMRPLAAVTLSCGQTIGLSFIKDCFFFHEHARKIGIWVTIFACAPFLSPLLGNFIVAGTGKWHPIFWMVFGFACLLVCCLLLFGDETYYNRSIPVGQQPARRAGHYNRLLRLIGVWQIQHHSGYFSTVAGSYRRLLEVFLKPVIPLIMLFYSIVFMWFLGIALSSSILLGTPKAFGGYGLGPKGVGYVFFTPIVGLLIGEALGHWFNDYTVKLYGKKHRGFFIPEIRLWTTYLGAALMVPGLVIIGQALQHHLPVVAIVFGWGMNTVGALLTSVATLAYVLDCYPTASGEVSALINLGRVALGFAVGYFQQQWGMKQGFDVSFGLQAVIVVAAYLICIAIQVYGARLRAWAGPVSPLSI